MQAGERIKAAIKDCIPWQARYWLKLAEAKGFKMPSALKYHNELEVYTNAYYGILENAGIDDLMHKTVCEMGVGDFLTHAFLEYQMGADKEYMLEIEDYAKVDGIADITGLYRLDESKGFKRYRKLPRPEEDETWRSYLDKINASYVTTGLDGYKSIPSDSVDFVFSDAVFEHIRKNVFVETLSEVYRFMRNGGASYHIVDFRDHMGGGKNQLRFSDERWEDEVHYRMDNYTNRISCSQIVTIMENIGFKDIQVERRYYDKPPMKKSKLAEQFKDMSDEDFMTKGATIRAGK